jgi:hypothetical protein
MKQYAAQELTICRISVHTANLDRDMRRSEAKKAPDSLARGWGRNTLYGSGKLLLCLCQDEGCLR